MIFMRDGIMNLKITGLKVDMGEEMSGKALAKHINTMSMKAEQEEDPEKKERLKQKVKEM